jgi:GNAT superfamily N-acetyltransferase
MVPRSGFVQHLNPKIYLQFSYLNLRKQGQMLKVLKECKMGNPAFQEGEVAYFEYDGKILSWTLVFKVDQQRIQYIYTRKSARGQGLGTQLALWAITKYPDTKAHISESTLFQRAGIPMVNKNYLYEIPWDEN